MKEIPDFGSEWVLEFMAFLASKWTDGVSYLKGLVSTWDSSTHRGAFNLVEMADGPTTITSHWS